MELRYYEAKDGWRWRLVAANGKIIAESGEAYTTSGNAIRSIRSLQEIALATVPVVKTDG